MPNRIFRGEIRRSAIFSLRLSFAGAVLVLCAGRSPAQPAAKTQATQTLEAAGFKSDDPNLLRYLADRGDPNANRPLAELIRQLGAEEWKVRDAATRKLKAMGAAVRDAVSKATTDPDPEIRARAQDILENLGDVTSPLTLVLNVVAERKLPQAVPLILQRLPDLGLANRDAAARALLACAKPEHASELRKALDASKLEPEARAAVIAALFQVAPEQDVKLLKACLADDSPAIRKAAVYAMYKVPPLQAQHEDFVPVLINLLNDPSIDLASRVAGFLGDIGDPRAGDALLAVLDRSTDYSFCHSVVRAVSKLKGRDAAGPLIKLLARSDASSRSVTLEALDGMYAPEAAHAVVEVLQDPSNHSRAKACFMLATYADANAVEPLCRVAAEDLDIGVRRVAAYALGRLGDQRAVNVLTAMALTDELKQAPGDGQLAPSAGGGFNFKGDEMEIYRLEAREQALTALAILGGPKALETIRKAIDHPQPRLRGLAIRLLAERNDPGAVDLALKGLADKDYFVTAGAVDACELLDDPRLREPLIKLVTSNRNGRLPLVRHGLGGSGTSSGHYSETYLREHAMRILKERWPAEARGVLMDRLKDSQYVIAARAADWLADANDRSAIPALIDLLDSSSAVYARVAAGKALCKFNVKAAFEPCLDVLEKSKDPSLATAMAPMARESFMDQLEAVLRKSDGPHTAAVMLAGTVGAAELADAVAPFVDHRDAYLKILAIMALGRMKSPKSAEVLIKRLGDLLDAEPVDPAVKASQAHERSRLVHTLAAALADLGDRAAVEPLLAAMNKYQKERFVVGSIAAALGKIGDPRAFEPMARLARMYPRELGEGLTMLDPNRALPYLRPALGQSISDLKLEKIVFKIDPALCVEPLARVLRVSRGTDFGNVRVEAVELLARVGNEQAIRAIRYALADANMDVRQAARKALAKIEAGREETRK